MKTILYLGTDPTHFASPWQGANVIHYPLIQIIPRSISTPEITLAYHNLSSYSHILFTSKYGVQIFFSHLSSLNLSFPDSLASIAIGQRTAAFLQKEGVIPSFVAKEESQEGVVALIEGLSHLSSSSILIPKSSLSRPLLFQFLIEKKIHHTAIDLYDTLFHKPVDQLPPWEQIDLFVFTSPSTVRAFIHFFTLLPPQEKCFAIGPITQKEILANRALSKIS